MNAVGVLCPFAVGKQLFIKALIHGTPDIENVLSPKFFICTFEFLQTSTIIEMLLKFAPLVQWIGHESSKLLIRVRFPGGVQQCRLVQANECRNPFNARVFNQKIKKSKKLTLFLKF